MAFFYMSTQFFSFFCFLLSTVYVVCCFFYVKGNTYWMLKVRECVISVANIVLVCMCVRCTPAGNSTLCSLTIRILFTTHHPHICLMLSNLLHVCACVCAHILLYGVCCGWIMRWKIYKK